MPISPIVKAITPTQGVRPIYTRAINYVTGKFAPAVCTVNKDQVITWDKVTYQIPQIPGQCEKVLAIDCSPVKSFAVTIRPTTVTNQYVVEIAAPRGSVITVVPHFFVPTVKVGDTTIETLDHGMPYIVRTPEGIVEVIIKRVVNKVTVVLPQTGLIVTSQGHTVQLETSQLFKKRMCGLCSNFDGQKSWEFEGPQKEVYTQAIPFALSYVLPSAQCPKPLNPTPITNMNVQTEIQTQRTKPQGSGNMINLFETETKGECALIKETKVVKYKNYICISEEPISRCPSFGCEEIDSEQKTIYYRCYPATHPSITNLIELTKSKILTTSDLPAGGKQKRKREELQTECEKASFF